MPKKKAQYLTSDGAARMREELQDMKGRQREEIAERLHFAIQQGDLSENADYVKSKEDQAFLEGKIQEYEAILGEAVIIEENARRSGEVQIGSHITIQNGGRPPEKYHVVGAAEANPREGRISNESPIGRAVMGSREGEEVVAATPSGEMKIKILKVE